MKTVLLVPQELLAQLDLVVCLVCLVFLESKVIAVSLDWTVLKENQVPAAKKDLKERKGRSVQ